MNYREWLHKNGDAESLEQAEELRRQAHQLLKAAVASGELYSLDGIESPLSARILEHHGAQTFEMNSNWICSSQEWHCPCCRRSKLEVSRLGRLGQVLAKLVVHHDHMGDAMQSAFHAAFKAAGTSEAQVEGFRLVERMGVAFAAYDEVLICEDCNNADTNAKRLIGEPAHFSFSIGQMQQFIAAKAHRPHELQPEKVISEWTAARPAYELRMRLIQTVAHAAATDAHWFEPSEGRARRVPLLGTRLDPDDAQILRRMSFDTVAKVLGNTAPISIPNRARWRTEIPRLGMPIPENFLAMLRSERVQAAMWAEVADDWRCPICKRAKRETVYIGEKGKVLFRLNNARRNGAWIHTPHFCNHCDATLKNLKAEVSDLLEAKLPDSYSFVTPMELSYSIMARPHSSHAIRASEAAQLVRKIVERLQPVEARRCLLDSGRFS